MTRSRDEFEDVAYDVLLPYVDLTMTDMIRDAIIQELSERMYVGESKKEED